jgi:hypothetical protein
MSNIWRGLFFFSCSTCVRAACRHEKASATPEETSTANSEVFWLGAITHFLSTRICFIWLHPFLLFLSSGIYKERGSAFSVVVLHDEVLGYNQSSIGRKGRDLEHWGHQSARTLAGAGKGPVSPPRVSLRRCIDYCLPRRGSLETARYRINGPGNGTFRSWFIARGSPSELEENVWRPIQCSATHCPKSWLPTVHTNNLERPR